MAGVQKVLDQRVTEGLLKLEQKLCMERRDILLQEELLGKQKSRNEWLKAGNDNTKFFYTSTSVRCWRNKVESLKYEARVWVEDKFELKELVFSFYKKLFSLDPNVGVEFLRGAFPWLEEGTKLKLEENFTSKEVSRVLKQMGSLKALGA